MTTNWPEVFANPEIDPAALLPLVAECVSNHRGIPQAWYSEQGRHAWAALPVLWENPAFALLPLDTPALGVLVEPTERCWLEAQFGPMRQAFTKAIGDTIRWRSMLLIEEVMAKAAHLIHPLLTGLWTMRASFPYFHIDGGFAAAWPDSEWQKILRHNRYGCATSLEFSAASAIFALQYDLLDPWVYLSAVRAKCLMSRPPRLHRDEIAAEETTQQRRLSRIARLHLIDHLRTNAFLDWDILGAAEEAGR